MDEQGERMDERDDQVDDQVDDEAERSEYAVALGDRLRGIRVQQGLSLHDVERRSDGDIKASVLGAYERGERAVSVARLRALADFYRVPIAEFLPRTTIADARSVMERGLCIDLTRLPMTRVDGIDVVERFLSNVQAQRRDYNGRVLTIRRDDLRALAAVLATSPDELATRLVSSGVASARGDVPAPPDPPEG